MSFLTLTKLTSFVKASIHVCIGLMPACMKEKVQQQSLYPTSATWKPSLPFSYVKDHVLNF